MAVVLGGACCAVFGRLRPNKLVVQEFFHPLPRRSPYDPEPECGNQRCEYGEECVDESCNSRGQCSIDCPFPVQRCQSGSLRATAPTTCSSRGSCSTATGTCACYKGYVGEACNVCDINYVAVGNACVLMPGALVSCTDGVRNGNEEGVDCGGLNCPESCDDKYRFGGLSTMQLVMVGVGSSVLIGAVILILK